MTSSSGRHRTEGGGWDWVWSREPGIAITAAVAVVWVSLLREACRLGLLGALLPLIEHEVRGTSQTSAYRDAELTPLLVAEAIRAITCVCLSEELQGDEVNITRAVTLALVEPTTPEVKIPYEDDAWIAQRQFLLAVALVMGLPEASFVMSVGANPGFWHAWTEWKGEAESALARTLAGETVPLAQIVDHARNLAESWGLSAGDRVAEALVQYQI